MIQRDVHHLADQESLAFSECEVPKTLRALAAFKTECMRGGEGRLQYSALPDAIPECFGADAP